VIQITRQRQILCLAALGRARIFSSALDFRATVMLLLMMPGRL
jgi:hypothetical protein